MDPVLADIDCVEEAEIQAIREKAAKLRALRQAQIKEKEAQAKIAFLKEQMAKAKEEARQAKVQIIAAQVSNTMSADELKNIYINIKDTYAHIQELQECIDDNIDFLLDQTRHYQICCVLEHDKKVGRFLQKKQRQQILQETPGFIKYIVKRAQCEFKEAENAINTNNGDVLKSVQDALKNLDKTAFVHYSTVRKIYDGIVSIRNS